MQRKAAPSLTHMNFIRSLKAAFRLTLYGLMCLVSIPLQAAVLILTKGSAAYILPKLFHRITCKLFGIKVQITGKPHTDEQTLFVCNHLSYLDIPVLGSVITGSFIAKTDVAGWPVFGLLAKLQRTLFVSRNTRHAVQGQKDFQERLKEGMHMILFPEGTSSDGHTVLPFKSSLFAAFETAGLSYLTLQPVTLNLLAIDGQTADTPALRDLYAYHGDIELPPHLWNFAGLNGVMLEIIFHKTIELSEHQNRKELAQICEEAVRSGLSS